MLAAALQNDSLMTAVTVYQSDYWVDPQVSQET